VNRGYWEERALLFSREGDGLKAVCSYGMPEFYNRAIDRAQRRALSPWLPAGSGEALDVGCGVGRFSRELARRGLRVLGVDLSEAMLEEARRRARDEGLEPLCSFERQDLAALDQGRAFPFVLGVTVLQHLMDDAAFRSAVLRLHGHVLPGGRAVFLEAAPQRERRASTGVLRLRSEAEYLDAFRAAGFALVAVTGVDPPGLKYRMLPALGRLPRPAAAALLAAATYASIPVERFLGRRLRSLSWHKVFVLERRP
jgi:SAM-dependent methyltransferase